MASGVYGNSEYGCHISSYISLHISDAKSRISVSRPFRMFFHFLPTLRFLVFPPSFVN